jgi:DHA1 family multidrug resistance protein-like MFS transporter
LGIDLFGRLIVSNAPTACSVSSLNGLGYQLSPTMKDIVRDALFGQIVRLVSGNKIFQYPEERPDFKCPSSYKYSTRPSESLGAGSTRQSTLATEYEKKAQSDDPKTDGQHDSSEHLPLDRRPTLLRCVTSTLPYTEERLQLDADLAIERTKSRIILPQQTADGIILVDWYSTDDPANPQNWSSGKKAFVALQIWYALDNQPVYYYLIVLFLSSLYTFVVYCGSAIYTSSEL